MDVEMGLEPGRHQSGVPRLGTIPRVVRNIRKEEVGGKTKVYLNGGILLVAYPNLILIQRRTLSGILLLIAWMYRRGTNRSGRAPGDKMTKIVGDIEQRSTRIA